jgi:hypothetical protein
MTQSQQPRLIKKLRQFPSEQKRESFTIASKFPPHFITLKARVTQSPHKRLLLFSLIIQQSRKNATWLKFYAAARKISVMKN